MTQKQYTTYGNWPTSAQPIELAEEIRDVRRDHKSFLPLPRVHTCGESRHQVAGLAVVASNVCTEDPEFLVRPPKWDADQPVMRRLTLLPPKESIVALAFATVAREVVGVDLTDAPLAIARQNREARGLT